MSWSGCTVRGWVCDGHNHDYIHSSYYSRIHPTVLDIHEMKKLLKLLKKNLFARARTSEKVDKDGKKILIVEEIDDPDYRFGDFRDEIRDVEKMNIIRNE